LALATNFVRKGFPVNLWEKNIKIAQDIKREHANTHFADIRSIYLNPLITISSEIEILKDTNLLVIAIPCRALKEVYQTIYHFQDLFRAELIIVGTTKGIEKETHHLPYQICDEALGQPGLLIPYHYVHLAGPGFAADVMKKQVLKKSRKFLIHPPLKFIDQATSWASN
jgi:glycerol-3-phosphate dehydrogenase (NAD(P)+)